MVAIANRIQDHGDSARQTLFDTGANSIGDGFAPSARTGSCLERGSLHCALMGSFQQSEDRGGTRGKKSAHNF